MKSLEKYIIESSYNKLSININKCDGKSSDWVKLTKSIKHNLDRNINSQIIIKNKKEDLIIELTDINDLSNTCWISAHMKDLGKLIGKDYVDDSTEYEIAQFDVDKNILDIANKVRNNI